MKKALFRKMLIAMGLTLVLCLLVYPLLLPTENYFRLVLQLLPMSIIVGAILIVPMYLMSDRFANSIALRLKKTRLDSKETLRQYPELKPLARQVSSLKAQIDTQMNELTGQQEQLKILTDNMQEGLLLVSAAGRVLLYNRAALRLLGKDDAGEEYGSVYDLSDEKKYRELVKQALDGIRGTATLTSENAAVQLIANPVVRENRLTGAVLVLLDVLEREKRDALRREFTSNVSHELKTPLTSIYGIADMIESGMVKKKDLNGFAARIRDESARMITLIEDIFRLSRLDDESFTEEVVPLDLYEIADHVKTQLTAAAERRHITMTLEGDTAPMHGVPVIVEEMLYNLCDNAIKYNEENGTVAIKVHSTGQQAIFTVTDTGIGIPQADKERVFERFYRVDKSHSKQIGGTGLGLSIVKHGAAFHNATIELESQLGSGTTITLFFPHSTEATALAEREALLDPLNVEIPGETAAPVVQIRGEQVESDDADAEDIEVAAEIAEDVSDDAEPAAEHPEDTEAYSDTVEENSEDSAEDADAQSEDTEEHTETENAEEQTEDAEEQSESAIDSRSGDHEDVPEVVTEEAAEPETAPVQQEDDKPKRQQKAAKRLALDETDQLLMEAAAELALDLFAEEPPEDGESESEEAELLAAQAELPQVQEPEPESEEESAQSKQIDVMPLDEETMDIRI